MLCCFYSGACVHFSMIVLGLTTFSSCAVVGNTPEFCNATSSAGVMPEYTVCGYRPESW